MHGCPRSIERLARTAVRLGPARAAMRLGLLILCVTALASCGFMRSRARAQEAVKQFHSLLDKGQYESIYDQGDDALKTSSTKTDFVAYLRDIHMRLGPTRHSTTRGFQVSTVAGKGSQVALEVETKFDRGTAEERFVWRITGNRVLLAGYTATVRRTAEPPSVFRSQPGNSRPPAIADTLRTSAGNFPVSRFFFRFSRTIHVTSGSFIDAASRRSANPSFGLFSTNTLRA